MFCNFFKIFVKRINIFYYMCGWIFIIENIVMYRLNFVNGLLNSFNSFITIQIFPFYCLPCNEWLYQVASDMKLKYLQFAIPFIKGCVKTLKI
jgi:hypothetical protein